MRRSGNAGKIISMILAGCTLLIMTGCFPMLNERDKAYRQIEKDQSIDAMDEEDLTMQSGMKFLEEHARMYLSNDNQAIFANFLDKDSFHTYYKWYSDPQIIKEDFRTFCDRLSEGYSIREGHELTNIYLSIDIKMVYDYKNDTLYLPGMYGKELLALEKFQVSDLMELVFNEDARDYLVENGFSKGIDKWIDAPEISAFFMDCPHVSIYNGELMTDFSKAVVY